MITATEARELYDLPEAATPLESALRAISEKIREKSIQKHRSTYYRSRIDVRDAELKAILTENGFSVLPWTDVGLKISW